MLERLTDDARAAVVAAQDEARALGHNYVGTEHLLLGLLGQRDAAAARTLASMGVVTDRVRALVVGTIGRGDGAPEGYLPLTPNAKQAFQVALEESLTSGEKRVGTADLLLALMRDHRRRPPFLRRRGGPGVARHFLLQLGVEPDRLREQLIRLRSSEPGIG